MKLENMSKNQLLHIIFAVLFFGGYFVYLWLRVNPSLFFVAREPVFFFDASFFHQFTSYPGGIAEYAGEFLSQLFYKSWLGAIVMTIMAMLITCATHLIIKNISGSRSFLSYIPAAFLLAVYSAYNYPIATDVAMALTLLTAALYFYIPSNSVRIGAFFVLGTLLYYVVSGPFLLFAFMAAIYESLKHKNFLPALLYVIYSALLPFAASSWFFLIKTSQAFTNLITINVETKAVYVPYIIDLFFVLFVAGLSISLQKKFRSFRKKSGVQLAQAGAILVLAVVMALVSFRPVSKKYLILNWHARFHEWHKLLKVAQTCELDNPMGSYQVNRALYHTGQLPYKMFSYEQTYGPFGLILDKEFVPPTPLNRSDIYFDLGHFNEAKHWAHEALTVTGPTGWNLQRLALVYLIEGNKATARVFLNKLEKTLWFQSWAREHKKYTRQNIRLEEIPRFAEWIACRPTSDFLTFVDQPENDLIHLLERNPRNKAAFEYLMAYYLITKRLDKFLQYFEYVKNFNYPSLPRHYEEALLVAVKNKENRPDLGRYRIHRSTLQRLQSFQKTVLKHRDNLSAAKEELASAHGDTYWYYLFLKSQ